MNPSSELTSGSMSVKLSRAYHVLFLTSALLTGVLPAIQERQTGCKPCPYSVLSNSLLTLSCSTSMPSGMSSTSRRERSDISRPGTDSTQKYTSCRISKQVNIEGRKYKDRMSGKNAQRCTTEAPLKPQSTQYTTCYRPRFYISCQTLSINSTIILPLPFGSSSDIQ